MFLELVVTFSVMEDMDNQSEPTTTVFTFDVLDF